MAFLVFYTPCPDETTAKSISESLLHQKLVACSNIFPIQSNYWWKGSLELEGEWVLLLKTRLELEEAVEQAISKLHPYEVPCILRMEARANEAYEKWIEESTRKTG